MPGMGNEEKDRHVTVNKQGMYDGHKCTKHCTYGSGSAAFHVETEYHV